MKVKLKDIAEASGVSIVTVSAALNNKSGVSDKRKAKIQKIAKKMGYTPSIAARLLKQGRNMDIALVINELPDNIPGSGMINPIISSFVEECGREKIRNQLEFTDLQHDVVPQCMSGGLVGGVIHVGVINPALQKWLDEHPNFPMVQIDENYKYCVLVNTGNGIYEAIQYLSALGHKKLGLLCGKRKFLIHKNIYSSFLTAQDEYGIARNPLWIKDLDLEEDIDAVQTAVDAAREILSLPDRPTAIISADMRITTGIIYSALSMGLKIPEDLSIISAGASWEAEKAYPPITCFEINWKQIMESAISVLRRLMNGIEIDSVKNITELKLIKRKSVANLNN